MVVVCCDTLLCATHHAVVAPAVWHPGWPSGGTAGHEGTPHQELGGSRARLGGIQAGLDGASPLQPSCGRFGRACMGMPLQHMVGGVCNKVFLIRLGITLTGFIAPVVVLICLGITLT